MTAVVEKRSRSSTALVSALAPSNLCPASSAASAMMTRGNARPPSKPDVFRPWASDDVRRSRETDVSVRSKSDDDSVRNARKPDVRPRPHRNKTASSGDGSLGKLESLCFELDPPRHVKFDVGPEIINKPRDSFGQNKRNKSADNDSPWKSDNRGGEVVNKRSRAKGSRDGDEVGGAERSNGKSAAAKAPPQANHAPAARPLPPPIIGAAGAADPLMVGPPAPVATSTLTAAGGVVPHSPLPVPVTSLPPDVAALHRLGLLSTNDVSRWLAKRHRPKKFICEHCQAAFSNNGQLKGHVRIHTGERPFKCLHDGCGKTFTRNEELTRHRRIHSGLRPYPCPCCGKRFGRKDHLKKHARTHQQQQQQGQQPHPIYQSHLIHHHQSSALSALPVESPASSAAATPGVPGPACSPHLATDGHPGSPAAAAAGCLHPAALFALTAAAGGMPAGSASANEEVLRKLLCHWQHQHQMALGNGSATPSPADSELVGADPAVRPMSSSCYPLLHTGSMGPYPPGMASIPVSASSAGVSPMMSPHPSGLLSLPPSFFSSYYGALARTPSPSAMLHSQRPHQQTTNSL